MSEQQRPRSEEKRRVSAASTESGVSTDTVVKVTTARPQRPKTSSGLPRNRSASKRRISDESAKVKDEGGDKKPLVWTVQTPKERKKDESREKVNTSS